MPGTGGGAREGRGAGGWGGAFLGIAGPIFSFSSSGLKQNTQLQLNNVVFHEEKYRKHLTVHHYYLSPTVQDIRTILVKISVAFPLVKCLKYILVNHYFYLSHYTSIPH